MPIDATYLLPLKLKYRIPYVWKGPGARSSNSGKKQLAIQGTGHRRRSYGPFDTFTLDKSKTKRG